MRKTLLTFLQPNGRKIVLWFGFMILAYGAYYIALGPCDVTGRPEPMLCSSSLFYGFLWFIFPIGFAGLIFFHKASLTILAPIGMFLGGFFVSLLFFYWYVLACILYTAIRKLRKVLTFGM